MEEGKKKIAKKLEEKLEKVVKSVASKEVITFKTKQGKRTTQCWED